MSTITAGKAYEVRITGRGKRFTSALAKIKTFADREFSGGVWTVTPADCETYAMTVLAEQYDVEVEEA